MLIPVLLFLVGLACLIRGGDWFVDGAVGIARRFHLPEILIGATVVSIGTTLPEVMVSTAGALQGHSSIAYGNAIGSVICNTSLIAAITIAAKPGPVSKKSLTLPVSFFFIAAVFYAAVAYISGYFSRTVGIVLLGLFLVYMFLTIRQMKATDPAGEKEQEPESTTQMKLGKDLLLLVVGAALIAVGARLLVDNGTLIAQALGVPETVIALTFVALGTSLPELVTAITSVAKGHGALSLGNVIGANLFNLVLVSGMAITLRPFQIPAEKQLFGHNASLVLDVPLMFAVMLILTVPAMLKSRLYRAQGIALLIIYFSFCVIQFAF
ncbi:MAG: calcium/sodium antiporter [Lachnospiraceae bacterium]|nr:calcium/sodium antiporter [Lachnospiraceae bacterium]